MPKTANTASTNNGKVTVSLPRARGDQPKELFVGINGVNYLIPRGKSVEVPDYVAEEIERAENAEAFMDEEKDRLIEKAK